MADLRQLGMERSRVRKGAVRPEINPSQIRGLLADLGTGIGLPFIDAASQAAQGNYGQAAISGLLDAPPVKMAGMALAPLIGMVRKAAPMDEALRIAQKNAAKPVSEGGLGLPPDNTPMDRARAMGFDMSEFHGTGAGDFQAFDPAKLKDNVTYGGKVYTSKDPQYASRFAESKWAGDEPTVMPVMIRGGKKFDMSAPIASDDAARIIRESGQPERADAIRKAGKPYRSGSELFYWGMDNSMSNPSKGFAINRAGFDVITGDPQIEIVGSAGRPQTAIFDPSRIRSRFAAFDPARINENNLLASLAALGISIPVMRGLLQEEEMQ